MKTMLIPANEVRNETRVQNSRFITSLSPAFSVEEARKFIRRIKAEFTDASHNVPAFIIGHGASLISHASDDGEPSGTAGRPALAVLQGSGLGDVAVVVTRYFGGTKLGKGGLMRAYGDAIRSVLEIASFAQKAATYTVKFSIPYSLYERTRFLINSHRGEILKEIYLENVTITCKLLTEQYIPFKLYLKELTHGNVHTEILESDKFSIFPINK